MESCELSVGRVFILRLHTGEVLHEIIEKFARENSIVNATLSIVGGADAGSKIVVGPTIPVTGKIVPLHYVLEAPSEITGTGTLFRDEDGNPIMHMHGSVGRQGKSTTGCFRTGVIAWLVLEVVITELVGEGPYRKKDDFNGFKILEIE